jgi:hypothetical protein
MTAINSNIGNAQANAQVQQGTAIAQGLQGVQNFATPQNLTALYNGMSGGSGGASSGPINPNYAG